MKKRKYVKRNENFVNVFSNTVLETTARRMNKLATKFRDKLVSVIENQSFNWKPLSEKYKERKIKEGYDPRIFIRTGDYIDSITVFRDVYRDKGVVYSIGVEDREHKGEDNDINLVLLARFLEFGTSKMPARPHWRPVWSMILAEVPHNTKELKREILREFKRKIK